MWPAGTLRPAAHISLNKRRRFGRATPHSTRPIFHKLDATIRGHVFCSFLALVLKRALEDASRRSLDPVPGRRSSQTSIRRPRPKSNTTASNLWFAPRRGPRPASPCVRPASRCRRPCARRRPADPARSEDVVPRRSRGADCYRRSII